MDGSDNPWEDYKENAIDLEYELHLYRQGKRFRVKDPILMDTKEQLLKECEDLGIINIEADNLTEDLIRDAIAIVKESEPYVKKAIEEQAESLLEYRKERTLYSLCYSFLPWLEDNEIDIIKKKADELEKKEEQRKADEYKSSLLKEAADFCDRIIGKQQKDETITRGQLEDIIANLFGEFDKLKDRID